MNAQIESLLTAARATLARKAGHMSEGEFAENWHAIEATSFQAECEDEETFAERRREEQMLGNWDYDNNHPIN